MTDPIRDAAQAPADIVMQQCGGYTSGPGFEAAEKARALTAALSAPRPAADERVKEHMRLVDVAMRYSGAADDFATEDTPPSNPLPALCLPLGGRKSQHYRRGSPNWRRGRCRMGRRRSRRKS